MSGTGPRYALAALVGVCLLWLAWKWMSPPETPARPNRSSSEAVAQPDSADFQEARSWLPQLKEGRRILFAQPEGDGGDQGAERHLEHLGHLQGADFAFGDSLVQRRLIRSRDALDAFEADDSLLSIARESELLFNLALDEAYANAFRSGSYAVFENGTPGHVLTPENLHALNFGAAKDGAPVLVCVYVDATDSPEIAAAEEYRNTLCREYWLSEAEKFNGLTLSERNRIVARKALPRGLRLLVGEHYDGRFVAEPLRKDYVPVQ